MNQIAAPETVSGSQTLAVSSTAVSLTVPAGANHARAQVLSAPIRCWSDGSTPTSSQGEKVDIEGYIYLYGAELKNFKAIRESGTDASLQISYYKAGYEPGPGR
jgi:hypothetical protein